MSAKQQPESEGNILTFLRIKPSKKPSNYITIDENNKGSLTFNLPDKSGADFINNSKLKHNFHFNGVLDSSATQDDVFNTVGAAAVGNALNGFNSTIFAYGQTGSGKTYTLTGDDNNYSARGIIPRAVTMIFQEFDRRRAEATFKVAISYMELYNEQGYDLLAEEQRTVALEDLPKVNIQEDEHGNIHFHNLAVHPVESANEALDKLLIGDTNRMVAETSMNKVRRVMCVPSGVLTEV